jgi:ERCC4-type nuclease
MQFDPSMLTISATKPGGKIARALKESGAAIVPIKEDEGNVDRYVLSKRLVIERRTGGGFLKGIMEKTLFTSAIYMREHFQMPVLIVEGKVNYQYSMMSPPAVRGALSSMVIQYGLNVLATTDAEDTVELITMMARQEQIGIPEISLIPKRKATSVDDMQRRLIEMLPGCGMVMARDLLQHFGSVKRIVEASPEVLHSMRGIGAKKAAEIFNVFNTEYEAVDTEKNLEDAIEAEPRLLFKKGIELFERQHYIYTDEKERHIVDLVWIDEKAGELILVELKRGALTKDAYEQICRYLDNAHKSKVLKSYLDKGMKLRGVLATVEPGEIRIKRDDVSIEIIDRKKVVKVLVCLRHARQAEVRG